MFTLILLSLLIIFLKSLHFIYLFQIKEYRFDRFLSLAKEEGVPSLLYSFHIHYPAKSLRNFLIIFYILFVLLILFLASFEIPFIYYFLTFIVPFSPFISFVLVSIGVYVTKFPAMIQRKLIILRARQKVKKSKTIFIGITGSFGKTSVKEYIYHILSSTYKTAKTDENQNTDVGIALSILKNLKKNTEFFVAEFGAYKKGEIKNASYYIPLEYGVLTGLGNQHVDLYGSRQNLIDEETYILKNLPEIGKTYIQHAVPSKKEIIEDIAAPVITYGLDKDAHVKATIISADQQEQKANIQYRDVSLTIETKLLGEHTIENLLPAIALALDLNVPTQKIISAVKNLPQIEGKLSPHIGYKKALVINDGVNSNVEGFIAAIHTLDKINRKNKIIISQGIIELGVEKRSSYEKILHELYKTECLLFTTDKLFIELDRNKKQRVFTFNDVNKIKTELLTTIDKHSAILIEGKFPKFIIEFLLT